VKIIRKRKKKTVYNIIFKILDKEMESWNWIAS